MPAHLSWPQIALRLALTVLAGALVGMEREEQGRPAGLRTSILVCLAASVAMIQVNLLLGLAGKPPTSYVKLDLFRLPLGILEGMGFIGGGAILRHGELIRGVTTAAALWFVTVIGLCMGAGLLWLGIASVALAMGTLSGLRWLERRVSQVHHANLTILMGQEALSEPEIREQLSARGFKVRSCSLSTLKHEMKQQIQYAIEWRAKSTETAIPAVYEALISHPEVEKIDWQGKES